MNHGVAITVTGGSSKPYASRPCSDCEKEGIKSPAHRILPSGRGLCLMHFERVGLRGVAPPERPFVMEPIPKKELRERLAPKREVANEEERNIVPKKSNVDWNAVQNERAAGLLTIAEIAKKYGTSDASVYAHTKGNGRKAAGGGSPTRVSRKGGGVTNSNRNIAGALADLRARRDKLNAAIATLEELETF